MNDLEKLVQHRDDILRAEIAGWLHNIGKLDPNFVGGNTPDEFRVDRYKFKRFASPDLNWIKDQELKSKLQTYAEKSMRQGSEDDKEILDDIKDWVRKRGLYDKLVSALRTLCDFVAGHGPAYFVSPRRSEILKQLEPPSIEEYVEEEIKQELPKWKQQYPAGYEHLVERKRQEYKIQRRSSLERELEQIYQQESQQEDERIRLYRSITLAIPSCQPWSLLDLLTLFWDDFFEKPRDQGDYDPGSDNDPDYHREYLLTHVFGSHTDANAPSLLMLAHGEMSGPEKYGWTIDCRYRERYEEDPNRRENSSQYDVNSLRLSTAFGYERTHLDWHQCVRIRCNLLNAVREAWENPSEGRSYLRQYLVALQRGVSDTRLPFNEISLGEYADSIAALFKTAVAQAVLTGQVPTPGTMRWRLASIRLNAFDFLFQVNQLADLLARKKLLQGVWDTVRAALEVETPIGSAVYTDEHGLVFVLPEWSGKSDEEIWRIIEARTEEAIKAIKRRDGSLIGTTDLRPTVRIGQPRRGKQLLLAEALPAEEPLNIPDPAMIQNYWSNHRNRERCYVCGLRPVGYVEDDLPPFVTEEKARERNLCGICLARRGRRSEEWATKQEFKETIWIDEVADSNGRVALVVGRFDLDEWLSGALVRSLAIGTEDEEGNNWLAKSPTFARIQRVWRTTAEFWQEVMDDILKDLKDDRRRILLHLERRPDLGTYHVYELDLGKTIMSVVWCPPQDAQGGFLVSAENLGYITKQLGGREDVYSDPALSSIQVEDYLREEFVNKKREPVLRNPEGASSERAHNLLGGNRIVKINTQDVAYSTAIPILAEPRTFMVLVPADKALDVVKAIKTKYEREMGKVRNRLPLHLGMVFAHRRTPLRAVLEAGRQMLKQEVPGSYETWTVKSPPSRAGLPSEKVVLADASDQFNATVAVELVQNGRELTWYVPLKMGDGQIEDCWYPYVFWKEDADGCTDPLQASRKRVFQGPRPGMGNCWLVHADELRVGDRIYFTPATFDFEWLDTNARRFEIAYDDRGQRHNRLTRPYLLDDFDRLERLWGFVRNLTITQRHQVIRAIEATREAWYGQRTGQSLDDGVFRQFVADTLAGANWPKKQPWGKIPREWQEKLVDAGVRGELADLAELHMEILKER